jgi:hypothetical protein
MTAARLIAACSPVSRAAPLLAACLLVSLGGCSPPDDAGEQGPGTDPAQIQAWLASDGFADWDAESDVFPTSEFGAARTYFGARLAASKRGGETEHPLGATAVREFYAADGQTLTGYAYLTRATREDGPGAWFFFESYDLAPSGTPQVAELAAPTCAGCHQAAPDFVQTPWPLR